MNDLKDILHCFEVVFKIIKQSTFTPDSLESVNHTLATLATIAKQLEDQIKKIETNGTL